MTTRTRRWLLVFFSAGCLLLGATSHWVNAASDVTDQPKGVWQPPAEDRAVYRDIVDFNIFRADRRGIAEKVDRQRNPTPPRETGPRETDEVAEDTPKDPDASWRLSGISHDPDGATAYLEHTETGELARIQREDDFSAGRVSTIGYETLVYTVDGNERTIRVGETMLGERTRPAGSAKPDSSGSDDKPASLEERLRALRESRAREQGEARPPEPGSETDRESASDEDADSQDDADDQPAEDTR